jgi:hypothetical protein
MLLVGVVALEDELSILRLHTIEIIQRPPVDLAEHEQDRKCSTFAARELQPLVGFAQRPEEDRIAVAVAQFAGRRFGNERFVMHDRFQHGLALKLALVKLFDPAAEIIHAIAPIGQRLSVARHEVDDRHFDLFSLILPVPGVGASQRNGRERKQENDEQ